MAQTKAEMVLWPLYIDFSLEEWNRACRLEYAAQTAGIPAPVLMVNSYVEDENRAFGGCCVFEHGQVVEELPMGEIGILEIER